MYKYHDVQYLSSVNEIDLRFPLYNKILYNTKEISTNTVLNLKNPLFILSRNALYYFKTKYSK